MFMLQACGYKRFNVGRNRLGTAPSTPSSDGDDSSCLATKWYASAKLLRLHNRLSFRKHRYGFRQCLPHRLGAKQLLFDKAVRCCMLAKKSVAKVQVWPR
jgi:hypothetical protein